ncbi:MAG: hypothetical protein CMJ47_02750 [Planctomyces sp.]|nr:hypothetical protein [Planctomyces sp.]
MAMFCYGVRSIKNASADNFDDAFSCMRYSKVIAFLVAVLAVMVVLKWPFRETTRTVPEEVTKTVIDTVNVPVEVTSWFFFTQTENKLQEVATNVTETAITEKEVTVFDPWMIIPMLLIGFFAAWLQGKFVQFAFARFDTD